MIRKIFDIIFPEDAEVVDPIKVSKTKNSYRILLIPSLAVTFAVNIVQMPWYLSMPATFVCLFTFFRYAQTGAYYDGWCNGYSIGYADRSIINEEVSKILEKEKSNEQ